MGNEFCPDADKEIDKYKSALDEIEKLIKNNEKVRILSQTDEFVTVETIRNVDYKRILDIIAEAKGENNANKMSDV